MNGFCADKTHKWWWLTLSLYLFLRLNGCVISYLMSNHNRLIPTILIVYNTFFCSINDTMNFSEWLAIRVRTFDMFWAHINTINSEFIDYFCCINCYTSPKHFALQRFSAIERPLNWMTSKPIMSLVAKECMISSTIPFADIGDDAICWNHRAHTFDVKLYESFGKINFKIMRFILMKAEQLLCNIRSFSDKRLYKCSQIRILTLTS